MTDENLEKKTRSGLKWGCIIGAVVLATAANGFYAGARYKAGVDEGRESGYEKGKMEGFAEGLAACTAAESNKPNPWAYGWVNEGSMFASLQRNVEGLGLVTYSIALNAPMIGTGEAVRIDGLDGNAVSYADNLPHDGLVDLITTIDKNENPVSFLMRAVNYSANQQLFDNADQSLKEVKAIFAEKQ